MLARVQVEMSPDGNLWTLPSGDGNIEVQQLSNSFELCIRRKGDSNWTTHCPLGSPAPAARRRQPGRALLFVVAMLIFGGLTAWAQESRVGLAVLATALFVIAMMLAIALGIEQDSNGRLEREKVELMTRFQKLARSRRIYRRKLREYEKKENPWLDP
jgi:hypothetical protein